MTSSGALVVQQESEVVGRSGGSCCRCFGDDESAAKSPSSLDGDVAKVAAHQRRLAAESAGSNSNSSSSITSRPTIVAAEMESSQLLAATTHALAADPSDKCIRECLHRYLQFETRFQPVIATAAGAASGLVRDARSTRRALDALLIGFAKCEKAIQNHAWLIAGTESGKLLSVIRGEGVPGNSDESIGNRSLHMPSPMQQQPQQQQNRVQQRAGTGAGSDHSGAGMPLPTSLKVRAKINAAKIYIGLEKYDECMILTTELLENETESLEKLRRDEAQAGADTAAQQSLALSFSSNSPSSVGPAGFPGRIPQQQQQQPVHLRRAVGAASSAGASPSPNPLALPAWTPVSPRAADVGSSLSGIRNPNSPNNMTETWLPAPLATPSGSCSTLDAPQQQSRPEQHQGQPPFVSKFTPRHAELFALRGRATRLHGATELLRAKKEAMFAVVEQRRNNNNNNSMLSGSKSGAATALESDSAFLINSARGASVSYYKHVDAAVHDFRKSIAAAAAVLKEGKQAHSFVLLRTPPVDLQKRRVGAGAEYAAKIAQQQAIIDEEANSFNVASVLLELIELEKRQIYHAREKARQRLVSDFCDETIRLEDEAYERRKQTVREAEARRAGRIQKREEELLQQQQQQDELRRRQQQQQQQQQQQRQENSGNTNSQRQQQSQSSSSSSSSPNRSGASSPLKGAYALLGLDMDTATAADVSHAFRKKSLLWHPDRWCGSDDEDAKKNAEKMMKEINHAVQLIREKEGK